MKTRTLTCALGAFVLATGIASAQTPAPSGGNRTGAQGNTQGNPQGNTETTRRQSGTNTRAAGQSRTYTGCLSGNATSGYTLSTMGGGTAAQGQSSAGRTSPSSGASTSANNTGNMTYTVIAGTGGQDLSGMVNQRVEIVGTVANRQGVGTSGTSNRTSPEGGQAGGAANTTEGRGGQAGQAGNTAAGGASNSPSANGAGMSSGMGAHPNLTVTSIRAVPGTCTQQSK